jgi:hypothetical protein
MKRYEVPTVSRHAQLSRRCPECSRSGGRIHQRRGQRPADTRVEQVEKVRMCCAFCGKTWTCQPEGMKHGHSRSQRVRALNLLLYALGLSYRVTAAVVTALGAPQSATSVYNDVTRSGAKAQELHGRGIARLMGSAGIVGFDGTGQLLAEPGRSHVEGLMFAVEFGSGRLLRFELLAETDKVGLQTFVDELRAEFGVQEWVGDDHGNHHGRVGDDIYWICTAHFKKAKKKRLRALGEIAEATDSPVKEPDRFLASLNALARLLDEPPEDGADRAFAVYRSWSDARAPGHRGPTTPEWLLKQLALELSEKWCRAWTYTNNATERAIGRLLKIRSKTMRGFKRRENVSRFVHLCDWMTHSSGTPDLEPLI